jgi:hypothetical protein
MEIDIACTKLGVCNGTLGTRVRFIVQLYRSTRVGPPEQEEAEQEDHCGGGTRPPCHRIVTRAACPGELREGTSHKGWR